jgi:hypothetical protein
MQQPWWQTGLKYLVVLLVASFVVQRLLRSRPVPSSDSGTGVMRHERWVLCLGLLASIFFYGLAILSNTWMKNSSTTIWTTLAFVGFGSLGIPLLADYWFAWHRIDERGIEYGSMFALRRYMAWSEVKCISFAPSMGWYVLESESGAKARVSILLSGLKGFASQVLDHVPRERIVPEACIELMLTASGAIGVFVDPDSEEWRNALTQAQATIPTLRELQRTTQESILVKYAIESSTGDVEHVWGELEKLDDTSFRATLETPMLSGEPASDPPFELPVSSIEDWVVTLPDGTIRGAFTTQAEIQLAKRQGIPLPDHLAIMEGRFSDALPVG